MKYLFILLFSPCIVKSQDAGKKLIYSNLNPLFGDTVYRVIKKSHDSVYISTFFGKTWNSELHSVIDTFLVKKDNWFKIVNCKQTNYFSRKNFKHPLISVNSFSKNSQSRDNYTTYIPQKIMWVNNLEIWHYKVVKISYGLNTDSPTDLFFNPKIGIIKEEIPFSMNLILNEFIPYNDKLK